LCEFYQFRIVSARVAGEVVQRSVANPWSWGDPQPPLGTTVGISMLYDRTEGNAVDMAIGAARSVATLANELECGALAIVEWIGVLYLEGGSRYGSMTGAVLQEAHPAG
jgi:hypothetical protein